MIKVAHMGGFTTRSDYARLAADDVAQAAQMGLITTRISADNYGRVWRPTALGLAVLELIEEAGFVEAA